MIVEFTKDKWANSSSINIRLQKEIMSLEKNNFTFFYFSWFCVCVCIPPLKHLSFVQCTVESSPFHLTYLLSTVGHCEDRRTMIIKVIRSHVIKSRFPPKQKQQEHAKFRRVSQVSLTAPNRDFRSQFNSRPKRSCYKI